MSHLLISPKDQKKKVKLSIVASFYQKHHMVAVVNLLTKCKSHIHTYIALVVIKIIEKKGCPCTEHRCSQIILGYTSP